MLEKFYFSDIVRHILAFLEDDVSEIREKQQWNLPLFAAYVTRLCGLQVLKKNYVDYVWASCYIQQRQFSWRRYINIRQNFFDFFTICFCSASGGTGISARCSLVSLINRSNIYITEIIRRFHLLSIVNNSS